MSGFLYQVAAAPAAASQLLVKRITLTGAEIVNSPTTTLTEVLPACGAGYYYNILAVNSRVINGSTPFAGGGIFFLRIDDLSAIATNGTTQMTSTNTFRNWSMAPSGSNVTTLGENLSVELFYTSGDPSAGNGTFDLWVFYTIEAI